VGEEFPAERGPTASLLVYFVATRGSTASLLAFATAAGCLAHSIEGDFNFSTREEIEALMGGNSAGRVKR